MRTSRTLGNAFALVALAALLLALAAPALTAAPAPPAEPVWGTKPVLAYFALTDELAGRMQRELGLDSEQFDRIKRAATEEAARLDTLKMESETITADGSLSLEQKQQQVAALDYNAQVDSAVKATQQHLESDLGPTTYGWLVEWIETNWAAEREAHSVDAVAAARSFKVYATRFDANGGYIAALPDKCLKFANAGSYKCSGDYEYNKNYSIKVAYGGNTVKVKILESGPWNVDDNYWSTPSDPQPRRLFVDLPLGMPESQAAYFDNYNGGLDQFGRKVTSPVALDLAKAVGNDLGFTGNAWVEVTYLWTEGWADSGAQVVTLNGPNKLTPAYANDMCGSAWHKITGYASNPAYLTLNVNAAGQSTNSAEWRAELPTTGSYRVEAFIPGHDPVEWQCPSKHIQRDTGDARYTITHAGGNTSVKGNQGPLNNEWLDLGTYTFNAGKGAVVKLADLNGEENLSHTISFSAMRWVYIPPAPTEPPPIPTPVPPKPMVVLGSAHGAPAGSVQVPLTALNLPAPGLGQPPWTSSMIQSWSP